MVKRAHIKDDSVKITPAFGRQLLEHIQGRRLQCAGGHAWLRSRAADFDPIAVERCRYNICHFLDTPQATQTRSSIIGSDESAIEAM